MGLIAQVMSFTRRVQNGIAWADVKVDPGGGSNLTGEHFSAPGDDSHPLPDDTAVTVVVQRNGGQVPVGYIDSQNAGKTAAGEKRVYGRDASGTPVNEVWLKADGSVIIENDNSSIEIQPGGSIIMDNGSSKVEVKDDGSILLESSLGSMELKTDGSINANGALITLLGDVISLLGRSLDTHVHSGVTAGPSNTGPPV